MKLKINISEMKKNDLHFLFELWHNREVMRYADEFPRFRGWSRRDDLDEAWKCYQNKREELGNNYIQLIIRLSKGKSIGESFFAPVKQKLGEWKKPSGIICVIGDIKLMPEYWGKGLGTKAMQAVVRFAFDKTDCAIFNVPPNRNNPAAVRVYEKAGFIHIAEKSPWSNHRLMTLSQDRYLHQYKKKN